MTATSPTNSTSPKGIAAPCGPDEEVIGGGANVSGGTALENIVVRGAQPDQGTPDSFGALGVETDADAGNWFLTAYALCASTG